jgi:hypothetical protein
MPKNPFFPADFDFQAYENWIDETREFEDAVVQDHEAREHYDLILAFI